MTIAPRPDAPTEWLHLTAGDPCYPLQLAAVPGCPQTLFVRGNPGALALPPSAIVGSRSATAAGRETAFQFAAALAASGLAVTSGLAVGIDAAAHRGALAAGGTTIAVCGTGLDRVYPAEHAALAAEIVARGALVSEFPAGTAPLAINFPRRNRILSGLARGVLVIEAAARSGSLITARLAGEQGRDVMAVPGSIHNVLSRGCHRLIKDGAALVESVDDVLAALGLPALATRPSCRDETLGRAEFSGATLDSDAEMLLNALGFGPADLDRLVERTGLAAHAVLSKLQLLELEGRVAGRRALQPHNEEAGAMKDSVLDILIHLFENFLDAEDDSTPERETLKQELEQAGYPEADIERALVWLESLATDPDRALSEGTARAVRVFSGSEQVRLDTDVRGYLLHLENLGILSAAQREVVIDRLLALEADDIDIEQLKWVVLMVLFSQPGQENAYQRMEDLVFDERRDAMH